MKNLIIISLLNLLLPIYMSAQVGINTTNPQASLDIEGSLRLSPTFEGNQPTSISSQSTSLYIDRSTGKISYAPGGFNQISGGTRPGTNSTIGRFTPNNTLADVRFVFHVHRSSIANNSDTAAYVFGDFKVIAMGPSNPVKFLAVNIRNADNNPKILTTKNDTVVTWSNGDQNRFGSTTLKLNQTTGALTISSGQAIFSYFFQILGGL